ncbi:condensation domain-containing protein, partial [Nonomuraea sp. NPDC005650]|uniref:condensation domain-containing protein n=1 Tax=Nonomuraea sp. NPDC005650 TaxID=3157045 RepID=UPI0033B1B804
MSEIAVTLAAGATLVVPGAEQRVADLAGFVREQRVDVATLPPSLLATLDPEELPELTLISAGEHLDPELARVWGSRHRLLNAYGPTETTVCATIGQDPAGIGGPIANTTTHVLDAHLNATPTGVSGELFVGGLGLARGYHGRPALTAERFVADPHAGDGSRLYRTGDVAVWRPEGQLVFLGRTDHQVKIRGFRIEPGEIQHALTGHPHIAAALVTTHHTANGIGTGTDNGVGTSTSTSTANGTGVGSGSTANGTGVGSGDGVGAGDGHGRGGKGGAGQRLVAYLVPADPAVGVPAADDLRAYLAAGLPDYMIPSVFIELAAFPLSPNGKIDRAALPVPDGSRPELAGGYEAPVTATEQVLAGIWAELLGVDQVGVRDNFFDLGGHSLLATQTMTRIRSTFGTDLALAALFDQPTIKGLATLIDSTGATTVAPPIVSADRDQPLPLSFAQQRLWFLAQLEPDSVEYNTPMLIALAADLDQGAMRAALAALVERHEVLRTRLVADADGVPYQVIDPPAGFDLPVIEVASEQEAQALIAADVATPFDLATGPLLRGSLIRLGDQEHILALCMHHVISDEWSAKIFRRELLALYDVFWAGEPSPLAPLTVQYADFALWQRNWLTGQTLEEQLGYWRRQLAQPPVLDLPTDRPRAAIRDTAGAAVDFHVSVEVAEGLQELSRRTGATMFMTLLAAYTALLGRYSRQDDVLVGTPVANRNQAETEDLIGFFVNTLVLRADLSGDPTFTDLLQQVRATALDAYGHQDLPFEQLVDELGIERDRSRSPLFQTLLNYVTLDQDSMGQDPAGLEAGPGDGQGGLPRQALYDLTVSFAPRGRAGLGGAVEYSTALFERATIERLVGHLLTLLAAVAADADRPLSALPFLTPAEQRQLTTTWTTHPPVLVPVEVQGLAGTWAGDSVVVEAGSPGSDAGRAGNAGGAGSGRGKKVRSGRAGAGKVKAKVKQAEAGRVEAGGVGGIGGGVHELIAGRAGVHPGRVAVSCEGVELSYGELDERANRLAHHLLALGVGPECVVGLHLGRTPELIVAILAVWKAGAAYLPLDPGYPAGRLAYMLADSRAGILLTDNPSDIPAIGLVTSEADNPSDNPAIGLVTSEADNPAAGAAASPVSSAVSANPAAGSVVGGVRVVVLGEAAGVLEGCPVGAPGVVVAAGQGAAVIYTSGSTGRPKGSVVAHGNLVALYAGWLGSHFRPGAGHRWLSLASISFDVFTADVVRALAGGGTLVLAPGQVQLDPAGWAGVLRASGASALEAAPGHIDNLVAYLARAGVVLPDLRLLIATTDTWHVGRAQRAHQVLPQARLLTAYGITETTIDSTYSVLAPGQDDHDQPSQFDQLSDLGARDGHGDVGGGVVGRTGVVPLGRQPAGPTPIGVPLPGTGVYVLDRHLNPVPVGMPGELFIAGAGLTRGYVYRPALTAGRFVAHPFAGDGSRLYRTGDVAVWRPDGQVAFLGRTDHQVKIRGFRIEPGEIQHALTGHPHIAAALVTTHHTGGDSGDGVGEGDGRGGRGGKGGTGRRLVAYLVPANPALGIPATDDLRAYLAAGLPDYMIPSVFIELAAFPLSPNGKIDRAALPVPDGSRPELAGGYEAPVTATEQVLAGIWADLLGVDQVGVGDNFFDLGGHSLLATQAITRIRNTFGTDLALAALFDQPTVKGLAALIDSTGITAVAPPIVPVDRDQPLPLSFAQQRLWFLAQLDPGSAEYNTPTPIPLPGDLDVPVLRAALTALVERHEVLRTRLVADDEGIPYQIIDPPTDFLLPLVDLGDQPIPHQAAEDLIATDAAVPFDLAAGPLLRASLLRLSDRDHILALCMHHVISDEWSAKIFHR